MMIGLVISSLSILAMLSLYRNLVHQAADSIVHSNLDGQVAAGLLTAQIELQSAGFGIPSAAVNQDLMLLAGASLSPGGMLSGTIQNILGSEQEGEAVVWGSNPTRSAYLCSALLAEDGGLILLRGVPCNRAIQFSSADWSNDRVALIAPGTLNAEQAVSIRTQVNACWPYGKSFANPAVQVIISAGNSTLNTDTAYAASSYTLCLPNLAPP